MKIKINRMLTDSRSTFPEGPSRIENIPEVRGLAKAEHWHHLSHIFSHLKQDKFNQKRNFAQINADIKRQEEKVRIWS